MCSERVTKLVEITPSARNLTAREGWMGEALEKRSAGGFRLTTLGLTGGQEASARVMRVTSTKPRVRRKQSLLLRIDYTG